jgi:DNA-directed RNA polymerase subunit F
MGGYMMKLEDIKKAVEELSDAEKREFFSEVIPDICDESLTKEGCRMIFEKKLSGSRYLESFDELHELQTKG